MDEWTILRMYYFLRGVFMKRFKAGLCMAIAASLLISGCGNGVQTEETEETSEETEVVETEGGEPEVTRDTEPEESDETEETSVEQASGGYVDLSSLYGRSMINASGESFVQHVEGHPSGLESVRAASWGVFIFPECELTITGNEMVYDDLQGMDMPVPQYETVYPVTDTGSGYEFNCTICYPDIVSSEGSLSGRQYNLISEEWTDPAETNPHVTCTYEDEAGNTYIAAGLLDPTEESCLYDENGNAAFVVMENVRFFVSYENAGDLYDAFIGPALEGSVESFGVDLANCYEIRFDEDGVISCLSSDGSRGMGGSYSWFYPVSDGYGVFEGMPQLYVVQHDYEYLSMNAPDVLVLFDVPLTVTDLTQGVE